MITLAIAMLIGIQGPQQDSNGSQKESPSKIMSRMFAHYAEANSVVGTIRMTQSAQGKAVHTQTELQFERPSKIFLRQVRDGLKGRQWLLTSDGNTFSYNRPDDEDYGRDRYVEYVTQHNKALTISEEMLAAYKSLGDVNPILESTVASKEWLTRLTQQWATLVYHGRATVNGKDVAEVTGEYRDTNLVKVSGTFSAYVTDEGELVRYQLKQIMQVGNPTNPRETIPVEVVTTWDSDLKLNGRTDPTLYRVVK
jgi:hypothetical protein